LLSPNSSARPRHLQGSSPLSFCRQKQDIPPKCDCGTI